MSKDYLMSPIQKNEIVNALFFNELDKTIRKPEEEFIAAGEFTNSKKIKFDDTIRYSYNSFGFRSDEFTSVHNGDHVLFAGCSATEGVGGSLESCWSYMTYSHLLKNSKLSGFFNVARHGWGYDIIISNIMSYINNYGKPDKIFILFPNIGRFYKWKEQNKDVEIFQYYGSMPNSAEDIEPESTWKRKITTEEQRSNFIVFTMLIKLFEDYCATNNIQLAWSTWDDEDAVNYKNAKIFKNFIEMPDPEVFIKSNIDFFLKNIEPRDDWERKRDGHLGYLYHYLWSKGFLGLIDTKQYE